MPRPATKGAPKPPLIAQLSTPDELPEEPIFENMHLRDVLDIPGYEADEAWQIDACKVERCLLAGRPMQHLKIWDSILVGSDMSACRAFEASIVRSEFLGCRLSGTQWGEGTLTDVTFQQCKLNLLSFRRCTLERVVFQNCVLNEADFIGARLTDVTFIDCELIKTDFSRVHCNRVDMTRNDLGSIRGVTSLKHVRIAPEQMVTLAPLLCAEVGFIVA
jgi:uncharacterized protein YjbI with pentapeptide repeats